MLTKAIVQSVNKAGNRCTVRMPLFETASSTMPIEAEALVSITPGLFNNIFAGDIVFVGFEENALEKPIILGKLFRNTVSENNTPGGACIVDALQANSSATIPSSTLFVFPDDIKGEYKDFKTPQKLADYIKWLEENFKKLISQSDDHFRCFKNWTQWQLQSENVEVDDGDIDSVNYQTPTKSQYQREGEECNICGSHCTKNKIRRYIKLSTDKRYPNK